MSEKMLNTRIQQKHDIEVNWSKAVNFIPKIGEIIVYDPDENHAAARVKIGDGVKTVVELAFIDDAAKAALFKEIDMVDEKVEALGQLVGDASIPEQIEEALLKTQTDWEVNDETNAAYVKNRTHWVEEGEEILPETYVDASPQNFGMELSKFNKALVPDQTYIAIVDGVEYECVAKRGIDIYPEAYEGNSDIILLGVQVPETFAVFNLSYSESENGFIDFLVYSEPHTIRIITKSKVKKIDNIFIEQQKQNQSNWLQPNENFSDFIKNKPFYQEYKKVYILQEHLKYLNLLDKYDNADEGKIFWLYRTGLDNDHCLYETGKTYLINHNGQLFDVVAKGDGRYGKIEIDDGEKYLELHWEGYTYTQGFVTTYGPDEVKDLIFEVYEPTEVIHQLDEKFIPSTIARVEDIPVIEYFTPEDIDIMCAGYVAAEEVLF